MSDKVEFKASGFSQLRSDNLEGTKKAKKLKDSTFGLLINPNIILEKDNLQDVHDQLETVSNKLWKTKSGFKDIVVFRNDDTWSSKTIKSVRNEYAIEYGKESKKLHIHVASQIKHWSNIHLNREKIIEEYATALAIKPKSIYLKIKTSYNENNGSDNIFNYVAKVSNISQKNEKSDSEGSEQGSEQSEDSD